MLTNPTIDMLRDLGLSGMASADQELETQPEARHLEHGEWLALLLERGTNIPSDHGHGHTAIAAIATADNTPAAVRPSETCSDKPLFSPVRSS
jgi:hypothetical protein